MKEIGLHIKIHFYEMEELPKEERELVESAIAATDHAYAKYSNFRVGAAIRLSDGSVMIGANQENAAFPSGLCAERTAIFAAQAQYPEKAITMLAVAARNENGLLKEPVTPCGSCRQVMLEVEDRYQQPMKVLLYGTDGVYVIDSAKDMVPLSFISENLKG
ncbi:MAG: cytidine deaminase [Prevotella sp.]|jgi:cytidine deaminase|nr:cytidine deaminase [Prevotella sp.]MBQ3624299.1 cytidine deaminase [Prevotella sp.]MBR1656325.1 cytidine deaminase [Prevotella sp.]MBR3390032.1 cytidine deaminase [Prevotella sp.]MBR7014234.1 cytidine deaminase [Prevotella sp.]